MKVYVLTIGDEFHGEIIVQGVEKTLDKAKNLAEKIYKKLWDDAGDETPCPSPALEWHQPSRSDCNTNCLLVANFESDVARIYRTGMEE